MTAKAWASLCTRQDVHCRTWEEIYQNVEPLTAECAACRSSAAA